MEHFLEDLTRYSIFTLRDSVLRGSLHALLSVRLVEDALEKRPDEVFVPRLIKVLDPHVLAQ